MAALWSFVPLKLLANADEVNDSSHVLCRHDSDLPRCPLLCMLAADLLFIQSIPLMALSEHGLPKTSAYRVRIARVSPRVLP